MLYVFDTFKIQQRVILLQMDKRLDGLKDKDDECG